MRVIKSEQIICTDIDGTLIVWGNPKSDDTIVTIKDPYFDEDVTLAVHRPNLRIFESRLARGATMIVWSANGYKWAAAVMKALGFSEHESIIVFSKPIAYIDDKKAEEFMGEHIYLSPDNKFGIFEKAK
jgi:hydroxymethylpyrimidine pyrophosphatase-like HAD family hydrolase